MSTYYKFIWFAISIPGTKSNFKIFMLTSHFLRWNVFIKNTNSCKGQCDRIILSHIKHNMLKIERHDTSKVGQVSVGAGAFCRFVLSALHRVSLYESTWTVKKLFGPISNLRVLFYSARVHIHLKPLIHILSKYKVCILFILVLTWISVLTLKYVNIWWRCRFLNISSEYPILIPDD